LSTKTQQIPAQALRQQHALCAMIREFWQAQGIAPLAFIDTYGCQQNEADSERIAGMLEQCGYSFTRSEEGADIVILNTCAIREHAEQRVFGNVGALVHTKRRHPRQKIFLCGCMMGQPHVSDRIRRSYPHVDGVFSTHHLWRFPELLWHILQGGKRVFAVEDSDGAISEGLPVARGNSLKAWGSVMYGCNNFCSYCIVPYVRGRERSREPAEIIKECSDLLAQGFKEITLLGQNVNSYGKDLALDIDFADLMAQIAALPGEFRLRFMTSHPKDASEKLFDTIAAHPNICKQFHLPFQSGNDRILREMNRRYTASEYLRLVDYGRAKMPDLVLTSDVIVGFPGETEAEFDDTLKLIERVRFDALFTFIYSPREGTPAAKMADPTSRADKNHRFDRLLEAQNRISAEIHRAYIGKTLRVLVDGREDAQLTARTDGGRLVRFTGDDSLIGTFLDLRITESTTWSLLGEIPNRAE
jgi:tRNA-2-methylthio-N6-dimethylallyladenosine synthase